jgi:hypothetical protein
LNNLLDAGTYYPKGNQVDAAVVDNVWDYYFYTADNTTVLVLWGTSTASDVSIALQKPAGARSNPAFNITEWNYKTYGHVVKENLTRYETTLDYSPILIELDYSAYLQGEGLTDQPLMVVITARYDPVSLTFIIGTVVLSALAIGIAWHQSMRTSRKTSHALKDESEVT